MGKDSFDVSLLFLFWIGWHWDYSKPVIDADTFTMDKKLDLEKVILPVVPEMSTTDKDYLMSLSSQKYLTNQEVLCSLNLKLIDAL